MKPYSFFAGCYDRLTQNVDYPRRAEYIREIFKHYRSEPKIVLDLACGTGSMSFELSKFGYDMIGVDSSGDMLAQASERASLCGSDILFICQDMCGLDLYGTVDAAICCLDSVNHLTSAAKVQAAFEKVSLFLNPGGLFVFDLNSEYKLSEVLGGNTFLYDMGDLYCVWENHYNKRSKLCRFDLTFFQYENGGFQRYDEQFGEKAYSSARISEFCSRAGMNLIGEFNELSFEKPHPQSERIYYVAEKRRN